MRMKLVLTLLLMIIFAGTACASQEFDAQIAQEWLHRFAEEIALLQPRNDVSTTADPARPGEYLLEYDFGTVLGTKMNQPQAGDILCVELTAAGTADCRGLQVGQTIEDVIGGREVASGSLPLYVLSTQESGYGWNWAYAVNGSVYGIEYISYGGGEPFREYTLTYVISSGRITAIRLKVAQATQAQAIEGQKTAEEIAEKQLGDLLIEENNQTELNSEDLTINNRLAVGVPVEALITLIGEPDEIQVLPDGDGRMLIYAFCAAELAFDEMTGVEMVRSVICVVPDIAGPRGVKVGMNAGQAASLFRCDNDMYSVGGSLYLAGEAQGIAPYGELVPGDEGQYTLRYVCEMNAGETGVLSIVVTDGAVAHWRLSIEKAEAEYGG